MALRKIFKAVIISQITYGASIWHMPSRQKEYCKTLVTQLAQVQALGAYIITRVFRAIPIQVLNTEAYLTFIRLELDKKTDQKAARLCLVPLYLTITQNRSVHPRRLLTPQETFEKRHIKLFGSSISKLEKRLAYITALEWQPLTIDIFCSKKQAIYQYNQYLAQKTALETLAYTNKCGFNKKIGLACIILSQHQVIKKFLETNKTSIVYIGEMQGI